MKTLRYLTDEDLLEVTHAALRLVSYYNAGLDFPDSAKREAESRRRTERQLDAMLEEAESRCLVIANRNYLYVDQRLGPDDRVRDHAYAANLVSH